MLVKTYKKRFYTLFALVKYDRTQVLYSWYARMGQTMKGQRLPPASFFEKVSAPQARIQTESSGGTAAFIKSGDMRLGLLSFYRRTAAE